MKPKDIVASFVVNVTTGLVQDVNRRKLQLKTDMCLRVHWTSTNNLSESLVVQLILTICHSPAVFLM